MRDSNVFHIIDMLRKAKIAFTLGIVREESITVFASVPGERWEIDIFDDGNIELEVFRGSGDIFDVDVLNERIAKYSD